VRAISIALQAIGALAIVAVLAIAAWIYLPLSSGKRDATFVLNWTGISTAQKWQVISSHVSARSLTGDYTDYYCIQLEKFEVKDRRNLEQWRDGPETNPLLAEAVRFGAHWAHTQSPSCFPSPDRANSRDMKIYVWSTTIHDRRPTAADVIFFEPSTNRLFYVGYKT
jgi:hypothetical protein